MTETIHLRLSWPNTTRAVAMSGVTVLANLAAALVSGGGLEAATVPTPSAPPPHVAASPLSVRDIAEVRQQFRSLIEAENAKDPVRVGRMIWNSPATLLVDKLEKVEPGQWLGTWGYEAVRQRLHGVIAADFVIHPDYQKLEVVGLTHHAAEAYAPVEITAGRPGQAAKTYPMLMIVDWVRTRQGWRMATDIALPIPPTPQQPS
jgi:hypothetical protein